MRPQYDRFGISYITPTAERAHGMFIINVIRNHLTPHLDKLQPNMVHDLRRSIDGLLGLDSESWRNVCLMDVIMKTITKSTNRVFFGSPLCEDESYLYSSQMFSILYGAGAVLVGQLLPPVLKPLVGYSMAVPIYIWQKKSYRYLVPLFRARMDDMVRKRRDPTFDFLAPIDMITGVIATAMDNEDSPDFKPEALAETLLFTVSRPKPASPTANSADDTT